MAATSRLALLAFAFCVLAASACGADEPAKSAKPRERTFRFTYSATVTDLAPGKKARIWLPIPLSNAEQDVKIESKQLPAEGKIGKEAEYGNEVLYIIEA